MSYITNFNLSRCTIGLTFASIANKIPTEFSLATNDPIRSILSDFELRQLAFYEQVLTTFDINDALCPVQWSSKSYTNSKPPAFHGDKECDGLHSDFNEWKIPKAVIEKNEAEKFTNFKNQHGAALESIYTDLQRLARNNFLKEFPYLSLEDIAPLKGTNTGAAEVQNIALPELEEMARQVLSGWLLVRQSPRPLAVKRVQHSYEAFGKKVYNLRSENKETLQELAHFHEDKKSPFLERTRTYLQLVHGNPEINLDGNLLQKLGFKPCKSCGAW